MKVQQTWRLLARKRRVVPPMRLYSSSKPSGGGSDGKNYSETMSLPKTAFPIWSEPSAREAPFRDTTTTELYKWQAENAKGSKFILHDGPPYANGHLHMGHALNKVLKDIVNRFQVLQGRAVDYTPGWDCHGLPIENKALQELRAGHEELSPTKLRQVARQVATRDMKLQIDEFKQFGIMADWSEAGTYRTMDHDYEIRQLRVLQALVGRGLIYRHYRPVHWSPSSKSALAEAELEYNDGHRSFPAYVKFKVKSGGMSSGLRSALETSGLSVQEPVDLAIWTTTPWTLPANMAIAVNPDLEYVLARRPEHNPEGVLIIGKDRVGALQDLLGQLDVLCTMPGSDLIGSAYTHIFSPQSAESPQVVSWNEVESGTGTGLVHMAPGHGSDDYHVLKSIGLLDRLPILCPVDEDGNYSAEVLQLAQDAGVGKRLIGKHVLSGGSKEVVEILRESNVLLATETLKHRYPYDWKTKKPIIVRATSQWFADVQDIKGAALKALDDVKFCPEISRVRLESFINERSEWCISRQRSWGVPIPALYDVATGEAVLTTESLDHIISVLEEKGVDHWFSAPVEDFVPLSLRDTGRTFTKGTDTVDVWFDSGTSWTLLKQRYQGDTSRQHLTDLYLEGSDQHRGWFQSSLLTAVGTSTTSKAKSPYKSLITHGFVLDAKGKKMSKSEGNIISPVTIINGGKNKKTEPAYGADVLRLWAASVDYTRDVSIGPTVLAQANEALRKLRNSLRFMLANLCDGEALQHIPAHVDPATMSIADKYVLFKLHSLEVSCKEKYLEFDFPGVVASLIEFQSKVLSSFYFDIIKDTLYADHTSHPGRQAVIFVLNEVLRTVLPIVAPILPHLAEEVQHVLATGDKHIGFSSVFAFGWRNVGSKWKNEMMASDMVHLMSARQVVLGLLEDARRERLIGGSVDAALEIKIRDEGATALAKVLQSEAPFLKTFFNVSKVRIVKEFSHPEPPWPQRALEDSHNSGIIARFVPPSGLKCPRCWQYTRPKNADVCDRCVEAISKQS